MKKIEWTVPEPRKGVMGAWDRFIGPGATDAEEWVQLGLGLMIGAGALALYFSTHGLEAGWLMSGLLVLLCLDLGGGIVTNATASAKRWYHRSGQGVLPHLRFVAIHGLHIAFVAWGWAEAPIEFFVATYGVLLASAAIICAVPLYLQRPVAIGLFGLTLLAAQAGPMVLPGLEWFVPLLMLKLLISHLVAEAPFARAQK